MNYYRVFDDQPDGETSPPLCNREHTTENTTEHTNREHMRFSLRAHNQFFDHLPENRILTFDSPVQGLCSKSKLQTLNFREFERL